MTREPPFTLHPQREPKTPEKIRAVPNTPTKVVRHVLRLSRHEFFTSPFGGTARIGKCGG
jgi:hypothetical protein